MMCMYLSMWTHDHIYSWKLGPGLVLLAKVCPWFSPIFESESDIFFVAILLQISVTKTVLLKEGGFFIFLNYVLVAVATSDQSFADASNSNILNYQYICLQHVKNKNKNK